MARKLKQCELKKVEVSELAEIFDVWELSIILAEESLCTDTDIMLENMLVYYVENEMYEYACVVRDEIKKRM